MRKFVSLILAACLTASACCAEGLTGELGLTAEAKPAASYTAEINSAVCSQLDFTDTSEYENAVRGLIDAPEVLELKDADGKVVWSQAAYSFLEEYGQAPDTVNPSLWENTKNNHVYGLFEVCEGIYQVRGYDMANLTVVKGETGWIVFDCTMSMETAQAAMQLIEKNLGSYPVRAVVISHSHADHFGGIAGVMTAEEAADESLPIVTIDRHFAPGIPCVSSDNYCGGQMAADKLLGMLPEAMRPAYEPLLHEADGEVRALVKAADKLAAHIKCLEEMKAGNLEFRDAAAETLAAVHALEMEEAEWFLAHFADGFGLTLDGLQQR